MRDCKCGKPVRLGAIRITVNRRRGVCHYISHLGDTKTIGNYSEAMMKPYPKIGRSSELLMERWEAAHE